MRYAVKFSPAFDLNLFMMAKELNFNLVCVIWKFRHGFCICKQSREGGIEATLAMVKSGIKIFARIRPTKKQVGVSCLQDHKIIFDQCLLFHTVCSCMKWERQKMELLPSPSTSLVLRPVGMSTTRKKPTHLGQSLNLAGLVHHDQLASVV